MSTASERIGVSPALAVRIADVQERIAAAARRAGRRPEDVGLIAVSKTHPAETVAAAYGLGLRIFGENRVEEALTKSAAVARLVAPDPAPAWHMVGHVQSRKAKDVVPWAALVQSVDGEKLARRLNDLSEQAGQTLPVLLEVNVAGEESKYGFVPERLLVAAGAILSLPALRVSGLMTVAPIAQQPEEVRPVFRALRELRDELAHRYPAVAWEHLSMGMTDDFEVAIEEGATLVRVGRAIFGARTP